ncbi:pilus assembly protein Flp/PilA [Faunimonas pinastri]|uniref:Pilus assembly protein Flp/PilA n=1 Tax=Faunimonas pinastri TaxID=1855383 RepID=A0A1H9HI17_9HYPH|nr:Flp family type IVb pilin [Faunimonas pinastri]SEQ61993.1 pilus assembly protein Flp/PilA [Faunimonas pinastri]
MHETIAGLLLLMSRYLREERGAAAVEYGLLATIIVVIVLAGIRAFGNSLQTVLDYVIARAA